MDEFDLNLLRAFDAVWRHGNLGMASKELKVSQPALSHALKRLRKGLCDPLFVKVFNGMQPTARAVQMAPVVQSVLASVQEHVLKAPDFDPKNARRTFTIAMTDIGEAALLPKLLGRLISEAPSVDVYTRSMSPRDLMIALQKGAVDLAIGYFPDIDGSEVLQQRLFASSYVCVVRTGHPTAHGRLTPKQFEDLPHAVVQTAGRTQEIVHRYLEQYQIRRRELLHVPHFLSVPGIIAATDLLVMLPMPVVELIGSIVDLQVVEPPYPIPSFDIKQYWHRSQQSDPGSRWLRSVVVDLFSKR